jgi:hypothetical protein
MDQVNENLRRARRNMSSNNRSKAEANTFPIVRYSRSDRDLFKRLYEISLPLGDKYLSIGLSDLETAVKDINLGQRQLDKIRSMKSSMLYSTFVYSVDGFLSIFGRKKTETDIYQLFRRQQTNVRELNCILASMARQYSEEVSVVRQELDDIVDRANSDYVTRRNLGEEVPINMDSYSDSVQRLDSLSADDRPGEYFGILKNIIALKRVSRKNRYELSVSSIGKEHHTRQIDNLMMQEELFETMLYSVMEMAFRTELYQKTLDSNIRIWQNVHDLSVVMSKVRQGIDVLSDYNHDLNESYFDAVKNIMNLVTNHPAGLILDETNEKLRRLVVEVNNASTGYRR